MAFDFLNNGKISLPTGSYIIPNNNIIQQANLFWKTKKELLQGSIVTPLIQEELFILSFPEICEYIGQSWHG